MAARERVEFDVVGRDAGGSKAFRQVGDAAEKAADQVEGFGKESAKTGDEVGGLGDKVKGAGEKAADTTEQYRGLKHEIGEVEGNVRRLAAEIDRTGNKELFKDLRKQQSELRKLTRVRDLLPDMGKAGEEAASGFASSFMSKLPAVMARVPMAGGALANPVALAIGAPLAIGVATLVGTAVGGAIIGGVGAAGVVGGLTLAAKDPRIKAAGAELGADLSAMLGRASASFVPETLGAINEISRRVGGMEGDFTRAFSAASRYVDPLVDGLLDAADNAMPGIIDAMEHAGPVINVVADGARDLGEAIGDGLTDLAPYADEGARALQILFAVMTGGVEATFKLVEGMAALYSVAEIIGAVMSGNVPKAIALIAAQDNVKGSSTDLEGVLGLLRDRLGEVGGKAGGAAVKVETLNEALHRLVDQNVSTEEANIALEEAIDRAAEAAKRNGDGIDANIPKQRENRKALKDIATATQEVYDRTLEQTGSHELAAAAAERGRKKFLETADAMDVEKDEAIRLANKLIAIPNVTRTVTVNANTQPALDSARGIVARINNMNARINVSAEPHGSYGGSAHTGQGYSTGQAEGGRVFGPGTDTSDSVPRRLSRDEFVVRARAARHVGYDFLNLINQADRRPGALAPATAAVTGSTSQTRGGGADEDALYRAMVRAIRATAAVVRDPGRTADIYARGG